MIFFNVVIWNISFAIKTIMKRELNIYMKIQCVGIISVLKILTVELN